MIIIPLQIITRYFHHSDDVLKVNKHGGLFSSTNSFTSQKQDIMSLLKC